MEIIWCSQGPSEDIVQVMDLFLIKSDYRLYTHKTLTS